MVHFFSRFYGLFIKSTTQRFFGGNFYNSGGEFVAAWW